MYVLNAKYYPEGDILKAGQKKGSSFTWQSIVAGIQTFKRGSIWRVGTGSHINLWEDPWIPSSETRRIITPRGGIMLNKVEDIIDPYTGQWDEALIRSVLSPVDAFRILQIPLYAEAGEDFVAWQFTRSGTFSVRSAYHVEFNHQFGPHFHSADCPERSHINPVWKDLWQL